MDFLTLDLTDAPHFLANAPLNSDGTVPVVSQGSPDEIQTCVYDILSCPVGGAYHNPTFGVPPLLGQTVPVVTDSVVAAVQAQEPRATVTMIQNASQEAQQPGTVDIAVNLSTP